MAGMSKWFRKEEPEVEPEPVKDEGPSLDERIAQVTQEMETKWSARIDEVNAKWQERFEQMQQAPMRQQHYAPQPEPEPEDPDVTDEELIEVLNSGKGGVEKIGSIVNKRVNAALKKALKEHVDPLRTVGLDSIHRLQDEIMSSKMPYWSRYKKEIDQYLSTVDPQLRVNPEMKRLAYNAVVGMHVDEIAEEKRQEAIRSTAQPPKSEPTGKTGRTVQREDDVAVEPEDLGGPDAEKALREVGRDKEDLAKKLGYKSWADYMHKCKKYIDR